MNQPVFWFGRRAQYSELQNLRVVELYHPKGFLASRGYSRNTFEEALEEAKIASLGYNAPIIWTDPEIQQVNGHPHKGVIG